MAKDPTWPPPDLNEILDVPGDSKTVNGAAMGVFWTFLVCVILAVGCIWAYGKLTADAPTPVQQEEGIN